MCDTDTPDGEAMTRAVLNAVDELRPYPWNVAVETATKPEVRRVAKAARELIDAVEAAYRAR